MTVCMLVYSFYDNDPRVRQYARALADRGNSVDVIALRREGQRSFDVVDGINVYRIQLRKVNERGQLAYLFRVVKFLLWSAVFLARKHFSRHYDFVHVHSVPDFLVLAAIVPKLTGAPVILDIHDLLPELYASKFRGRPDSALFKVLTWVERLSSAFANHTIIANHLWQDRLISRSVPARDCTTIRNYPDPALFHSRLREVRNANRFLMLYPGTLNRHQGLSTAIQAFAQVRGEIPGAQFHIYGEGPAKPELITLAAQLGLEETVRFFPPLPTRQIAEKMAEADLAIEPKSAASPFGNEASSTKILEFMAVGVPVIVSKTSIHQRYYSSAMVQFFEPDNADRLAECMLALYRDPAKRASLVAAAAENAAVNNWDVKRIEYLQLVDHLVQRGSTSFTKKAAAL